VLAAIAGDIELAKAPGGGRPWESGWRAVVSQCSHLTEERATWLVPESALTAADRNGPAMPDTKRFLHGSFAPVTEEVTALDLPVTGHLPGS
jgi:hypothetical protein